jgi:hypothetical protein
MKKGRWFWIPQALKCVGHQIFDKALHVVLANNTRLIWQLKRVLTAIESVRIRHAIRVQTC